MRNVLFAAAISSFVCAAAFGDSSVSTAGDNATVVASSAATDSSFDFPRPSKDQTRAEKGKKRTPGVKPLAPCGGCYCHTSCQAIIGGEGEWGCESSVWFAACGYFGITPCNCGACACQ